MDAEQGTGLDLTLKGTGVQGVGLAHQYIYPQAFIQPSLVLPAPMAAPSSSSITSTYTDYSAAYAQYAATAAATSIAFEQYPYAASPGYLGYSYTPSPATATAGPTQLQQSLPSAAAFLQYPAQQVQPDRMQ
ncbi:RNA-binding protein 38-like [Arapaima gigas]